MLFKAFEQLSHVQPTRMKTKKKIDNVKRNSNYIRPEKFQKTISLLKSARQVEILAKKKVELLLIVNQAVLCA